MQIGMIGLGRMGANMARRLLNGGHQCVVFDRAPKAVQELVAEKADRLRKVFPVRFDRVRAGLLLQSEVAQEIGQGVVHGGSLRRRGRWSGGRAGRGADGGLELGLRLLGQHHHVEPGQAQAGVGGVIPEGVE